jgi:hypothetical protein
MRDRPAVSSCGNISLVAGEIAFVLSGLPEASMPFAQNRISISDLNLLRVSSVINS